MNKGKFICCICNKEFSRRDTIVNTHFSRCVRKYGNPLNLPWDHHPSCRWNGRKGLSGRIPLGYDEANKLYLKDWPEQVQNDEEETKDDVDGDTTINDNDGDDATFNETDEDGMTSDENDDGKVSTGE